MSDFTLDAPILIGSECKLTLSQAKQFAKLNYQVKLNPVSQSLMEKSHQLLKSMTDQRLPVYGINTHFGDQVNLLDENLKADENNYYDSIQGRQENLIRSHCCGLGDIVPWEIVRVAMMLRIHCLSQGYSGVTPKFIDGMVNFLNSGIVPIVRRYGSIGASGDLVPLAMIAAGITGQDTKVYYQNKIVPAKEAIHQAGLTPLIPKIRDGLAMINGTSFMTAIASLAMYDMNRLYHQMLSAIAMALESMLIITSAYQPLVHQLKRQTGEITVSEYLLNFWQGSELIMDLDELRHANLSQEQVLKPVQDYYSLRSVAQGFGPFQENLPKAIQWIENEMNSVNDNPIIDTAKDKIYHGANFMGYYVTTACDLIKMDIAQASSWIHALLANLVHPRKSHGLPANIINHPDRNNGYRPIQLLAASIAVQNRKLAQAQQAYQIPTEGDNQDVSSLGTHAAFDLREAVMNLERLTAILLLASCQALDLRGIKKASPRSQQIYQVIREYAPTFSVDKPMSDEIFAITKILEEEKI